MHTVLIVQSNCCYMQNKCISLVDLSVIDAILRIEIIKTVFKTFFWYTITI